MARYRGLWLYGVIDDVIRVDFTPDHVPSHSLKAIRSDSHNPGKSEDGLETGTKKRVW